MLRGFVSNPSHFQLKTDRWPVARVKWHQAGVPFGVDETVAHCEGPTSSWLPYFSRTVFVWDC